MPSFFDDSDEDEFPAPLAQASRPFRPSHQPNQPPPQAQPGPGPSSSLHRYSSDPYAHSLSTGYDNGDDDDTMGGYSRPTPAARRDVSMGSYRGEIDSQDYGMHGPDGGNTDGEFDTNNPEPQQDVEKLMRAWVAERGCPGFLRYEDDLVENVIFRIGQQKEMVSVLLSEASTSEEEHFKLMLVQTELERAKFLLRSYLRTRLAKVEQYAHHLTLSPTTLPLLSELEQAHAQKYHDLVSSHYQHSVLDSLPDQLGKLDAKESDGTSMVSRPNPMTAVFIHCRRDISGARLPSGEVIDLPKGTTHLLRWAMAEPWVRDGRAELI